MLTDKAIKALKPGPKPRWVSDGDGLDLVVSPNGALHWYYRYRFGGKQQRIPIGPYGPPPAVSLKAARRQAADYRAMVRQGIDPRGATRGATPAATAEPAPAEPEAEHESVDDLLDCYLAERGAELRPGTMRTYRSPIAAFRAWCAANQIHTVDQITARVLASYRTHVIARPRRQKKKGGKRTDVITTQERRSSSAINGELRTIRSVLQTMHDAERLPSITSSEALAKNLKQIEADEPKPDPLDQDQIRELLAACRRYDREWEPAIEPFVLTMLLGGFRLGELLNLRWGAVNLRRGSIRVVVGSKKRTERDVNLQVSPYLITLFERMLKGRPIDPVFPYTHKQMERARHRLISEYGAPPFLWSVRNSKPGERSVPTLRSTCGSFLVCAPSIYGGSSLFMAASRLGHTTEVAERNYVGAIHDIPNDATTLEAAMGIADMLEPSGRKLRRVK